MAVPVWNYVALTKNWGEFMQTGSGEFVSSKTKAQTQAGGDIKAALVWMVLYVVIVGVAMGDSPVARAIALAAQ
jgi:hypothetical protein